LAAGGLDPVDGTCIDVLAGWRSIDTRLHCVGIVPDGSCREAVAPDAPYKDIQGALLNTWKPITLDELNEVVQDQLERCTAQQRVDFSRFRVPFQRVGLHRLGSVECGLWRTGLEPEVPNGRRRENSVPAAALVTWICDVTFGR
jgi:hypothetical protein